MAKKIKLEPVLISSREGFQAVVGDCVSVKLDVLKLNADMEEEINNVRRRYQTEIDPKLRIIQAQEAGLNIWSLKNKTEFGGKKSIDLPTARVGFRTTPHGCDKITKKTWGEVAQLLNAITHTAPDGSITFKGADYVKEGDLSVDKESLLRDRSKIPAEALAMVGIQITQDEIFYIEPKSEILESTKVAA